MYQIDLEIRQKHIERAIHAHEVLHKPSPRSCIIVQCLLDNGFEHIACGLRDLSINNVLYDLDERATKYTSLRTKDWIYAKPGWITLMRRK